MEELHDPRLRHLLLARWPALPGSALWLVFVFFVLGGGAVLRQLFGAVCFLFLPSAVFFGFAVCFFGSVRFVFSRAATITNYFATIPRVVMFLFCLMVSFL